MIMVSFEFLSEPIVFDENKISVLCIENHKLFRNIYNALISEKSEESNIVFSENFIPFKTKGNICVIDDFFRLSYSNTIIKKLYEQIEKFTVSDLQHETWQLKAHLINFMELIVKSFDYDFDFNYDINLSDIFKMLNLKPATDKNEILDILLDYILILNRYAPPKCFVLLNLHLYFSIDELNLFYNDIVNNHITVLVLENTQNFYCSAFENVIVYDNDFCEIVENI